MAELQAQTATETLLHSFVSPPKGANPYAGVIRDSAGNFYGSTNSGGAEGAGVVFKVSAAGHYTVLYTFTGGADGNGPLAGVIRDSAGNLYGTTYNGGTANAGVVFKLDTAGQETVLYSFTGGTDGGYPYAGVIEDSAGNLYGTTYSGGTANAGVVFKLDTAGQETVLYSFTGGTDGGYPYAGVIQDSSGNLYGTASGGGTDYAGVVYKVSAAGQETVLCSFTGGAHGGYPYAAVIRDSAGNLYGTASQGGTAEYGVVYKVNTAGQETVLHNFMGGADGSNPLAGLIRDSSGNLYGTTSGGGTPGGGVVYEVSTAGEETVLYSFTTGADGGYPYYGGVIRDSSGNLYGTTVNGGTAQGGVVYKLDSAGQETLLYSFPGAADGRYPLAGVIRDSAGNLYGTTVNGGKAGVGVVYKVAANGSETVLYTFTGGADGLAPYYAGVIRDSAGNLYGTTVGGGNFAGNCGYELEGCGVIFKLDPTGQETYAFSGGADGNGPFAGVIRDSAGNLYGTTYNGGTTNAGVVFKLDAAGQETVLYSFTGGTDGGYPYAGVIRDSAGNLYGTTYNGGTANAGVVFKLDTAGQETVLYSFTGGADGGYPYAGVIEDSAGNLYGTTAYGGARYAGVVYKVNTAGQETVLYSFTGGPDGGYPYAGVIEDSAGNLYGTTQIGGASGAGVVYKVNTSDQETVLYNFTGGADGRYPYAGVIQDSSGNLYGTTSGGGKESSGVVFKLSP
jgi:uncharacterized repeat protein (TIGR03803 family)